MNPLAISNTMPNLPLSMSMTALCCADCSEKFDAVTFRRRGRSAQYGFGEEPYSARWPLLGGGGRSVRVGDGAGGGGVKR